MKLVLSHCLHPSCSYPCSCCPPAASHQHPLNSFHLFHRFPSGASSGSTAYKCFWIFHYQGLRLKISFWRFHIHYVQLFQRSTPGKPNLEWGNADFWVMWMLTHAWIHSAGFGWWFLSRREITVLGLVLCWCTWILDKTDQRMCWQQTALVWGREIHDFCFLSCTEILRYLKVLIWASWTADLGVHYLHVLTKKNSNCELFITLS